MGELSSTVNFDAWGCGWPLAFGAVVWSLWLNKNALVFDPDSTSTVSVLDHSRRVVDSYNLAIATSSGVWVVMGFFPPPSVVYEVLRQDMQASGAVVARASHEVLQEMPTSGVG
ncbi:hypothetical protein V6N13_020703 [Hibiscus sabdariffa]